MKIKQIQLQIEDVEFKQYFITIDKNSLVRGISLPATVYTLSDIRNIVQLMELPYE